MDDEELGWIIFWFGDLIIEAVYKIVRKVKKKLR